MIFPASVLTYPFPLNWVHTAFLILVLLHLSDGTHGIYMCLHVRNPCLAQQGTKVPANNSSSEDGNRCCQHQSGVICTFENETIYI